MQQENKRNRHKNLTNALWADRVSTKRSINISPFQLVYGVEKIFPTSLVVPMMKILQEIDKEPNDIQRRINQKIHLQQSRDEVFSHTSKPQEKIKNIYDNKTKANDFKLGYVVLHWDA